MDQRLRDAFDAVDRRGFLPAGQRRWASNDRPLAIGHGQTNSQPSTVAAMLDLLAVEPGHRVLDVGSGSGWTTALLGHLVGPTGQVVGVELIADLARWGGENLAAHHMPWTSILLAEPGTYGVPELGPYDRILVSAGADDLPEDLVDQLAPGGRMVIPVDGRMLLVRRRPDGSTDLTTHGWYRFVPLLPEPPA